MRSAAAITAALLAGGMAAGAAYADLPSPPTVPTLTTVTTVTTVSVPSLPLQPPPAPSLPSAPVPAPAPTPTTSTVTNAVATPVSTLTGAADATASSVSDGSTSGGVSTSGGAATTAGATGRAGSFSGGSLPAGGPAAPSSAAAAEGGPGWASPLRAFHTSRPFIVTTGERARSTILRFRLQHRARVVFTVIQVSPRCQVMATFSVVGHRGLNRIRFGGRVDGRPLPAGTYRIDARTPAGQRVLHVALVVVTRAPTPAQLAAARRANACPAGALSRLGAPALASVAGPRAGGTSEIGRGQDPSTALGPAAGRSAQPQASGLSPAAISRHVTSPLVLATLGLAIVLLGLAALPGAAVSDPRLTYIVERHRSELALAGAAALAAAIVAVALG